MDTKAYILTNNVNTDTVAYPTMEAALKAQEKMKVEADDEDNEDLIYYNETHISEVPVTDDFVADGQQNEGLYSKVFHIRYVQAKDETRAAIMRILPELTNDRKLSVDWIANTVFAQLLWLDRWDNGHLELPGGICLDYNPKKLSWTMTDNGNVVKEFDHIRLIKSLWQLRNGIEDDLIVQIVGEICDYLGIPYQYYVTTDDLPF